MHERREPSEEPPCDTCRVDPMPENREALVVFMIVRNQLIMGPMSPIDINHLAIYPQMEIRKINNRRQCFDKVLHLARWYLERIREKK